MSAAKQTNSRQHNLAGIKEDIKSTPRVGRFVSGLSSITKFVRRMVSAGTIPVTTGSCGRNNSVAGYWNAKRVFASLALISELFTVALYNGSVNFSSLLAIQPAQAASGIAKMVNYQGRLMNSSGNAVTDGTYSIKFTIYNSLNNGNQLWSANTANGLPTGSPVAINVTVKNGLFSVLLGDTSAGQVAFPENLFNNDGLYLGVTVGTDSEMKPRKRLSAVPYAYNADALQGQHASATTPSWGGNTFALSQNSTNAATSTRSAFYVHTSGTSNVFDYLIRGNNGSDVFSVNRQGNVTTTGNLEVRGYTRIGDATTDRINVQAGFVSDLTPATDNTYSLGTAALRWKNLYASYVSTTNLDALGYVSTTNLYVNGNQITGATPTLQQVTNVGATTNKWIKFSGATSIGDFMPSSTNMYSLGSSNYRWKGVWAKGVTTTWLGANTVSTSKLYVNGTEITGASSVPSWQDVTDIGAVTDNWIQFAGGTSTGNFVPNTTNALSLGTSANRWKDVWGTTVHVGTSTWDVKQNADSRFAIGRNGGTDKLTVSLSGTVSAINPTITRVSGFDFGGNVNTVFVSGKLAYVGTDVAPGLRIYDISDPVNPTMVGSVATGVVKSLYVSGKYLYSGDSGSGDRFSVFDISDPSAPTLKGSVYFGGNGNMPIAIKVVGKYAYGGVSGWGYNHFAILDISNPSNPTLVSLTAMPGGGKSLDVVGKYAYVSDSSANLLIYDVSNPYAPVLKSTTASIAASDIKVRGTIAYIGSWDGSKGFRIYNVADPTNPKLIKELMLSGYATVSSVSLANDYAYLSTGGLGLAIFNIASTTNPVLVTSYGYNASSDAKVMVSGKYAHWVGANMSPEYTEDWRILDIGGLDTAVANIGSISGDYLNVSSRAIMSELIADSVAVGNGGLWSNGQLGAYGTSTLMGRVGIGTSTPTSSKLVVAGGVNPSVTNLYSLGSSSYRWKGVWAIGVTSTWMGAGTVSTTKLYVNGTEITGASSVPSWQQVTNVGATTNKWIKFAGATSIGDIVPSTTSMLYSLGSSNYRWRDVWASSTRIGTSTWELWQSNKGFTVSRGLANRYLTINNNGYVAIGTSTAQSKLHVANGNILVSGRAQDNGIDNSTKLMLHANGTGNSFVDSSLVGNTIYPYGNVTQSASQSKFGGKSAYFDGSGDYLKLDYTSNFDLSSGDFTIDTWFNADSFSSSQVLLSKDTYGSNFDWSITLVNNTTIGCWTNATFNSLVVTVPAMTPGNWYHVALVRKNGVNTFYLNGVGYGSNSMSITNSNQTAFSIGASGWNNPGSYFKGYIDEMRISKGIARWDADFTPPSVEYSDSVSSGIQVGFDTMPAVYNSLDVNGAFALGTYAGVERAPSNGFIVSGSVGIGTSSPTSSKLVVAGGINPSATNLYSLGSSDYRWKNLWVKNVSTTNVDALGYVSTTKLYVNGTQITGAVPSLQQVTNVGATTNKWIKFAGATSIGDFMPSSTNMYSLGSSNYRWKGVWAVGVTSTWIGAGTVSTTKLYVNGSLVGGTPSWQQVTNVGAMTNKWIKFSGATSVGNVMPSSTNTYDLGSSNYRWRNVWAKSVTSTWVGANAVSTTYAYANLTQQRNFGMSIIATTTVAGASKGAYIKGNYLYLAAGTNFNIYDISNPRTPALVSANSDSQNLVRVKVVGNTAYALDWIDGLKTYDISNPNSPVLLWNADLNLTYPNDRCEGIEVEGNYAYTTCYGQGFKIYNISNPKRPLLVKNISTSGATGLGLFGKYALITNGSSGVVVYDVSDPANATQVGSSGSVNSHTAVIQGRYAFVGSWTSGLAVFDLKNPTSPALVYNDGASLSDVYDIQILGKYLFLMNQGGGIKVYDITNPTSPVSVGTYFADATHSPSFIIANGRYAYLSNWSTSLYTLDMGGLDVQFAHVGSLEASTANVEGNVVVGRDLKVNGGLNVGQFGIYSLGGLSSNSTNTFMGNTVLGTNSKTAANYFTLTSAGNVGPSTTNAFDLGSTAYRWRNLFNTNVYASGTIQGNQMWMWGTATHTGDVMPSQTNTYSLGSSNYRWKGIWAVGVTSTWIGGGTVSTTKLYVNGVQITGTGTVPSWQQVTNVGAMTNKWIKFAGATSVGNVMPSSTLTYDLGSSNYRWKDVWASSTRIGTSTWELWQSNVGFTLSKSFVKKLQISNAGTVLPGSNNTQDIGTAANSWSTAYASNLNAYTYATATLAGSLDTPSNAYDAVIQGKYAYVADYSSLRVIDISYPTKPVETGSVALTAYDVAVAGDYAYVAGYNNNTFYIVDISNPSSPSIVKTQSITGIGYGVAVSGKYLYLANDTTGLKIYDISNPTSPTLIRTITTAAAATDVYVQGDYAYVSAYSGGLDIIDISNPYTASVVGNYNTPGYAWDVYVSGRYAYVADEGQGLTIVDVKNPASPTLAKSFTSVTGIYGVSVAGDYAYLEGTGSALYTVNVSSSTAPVLVSRYGVAGASNGCAVASGKMVLVCDGSSGIKLFNVSGVSAPTASIGNISTNDITINGNAKAGQVNTNGLNVAGNALIAGRLGTSATATFMGKVGVGTLTPNYFALQVAGSIGPDSANSYDLGSASMPWRNSYEFTTNNYTTLTPTLTASLDTAGNAYDTFVKGDYAYVADYGYLRVIDITNPSYPKEVGSVAVSNAYDVYVAGNYAFVAGYNNNYAYIVDVSNPTTPRVVGSVAISGTVYGIYASGKYMYVANDSNGLKIYDISNIASPTLVKTVTTNAQATDVVVQGSYAYVSVYSSGLDIINISNPATASVVGNYNTPGYAWDVYVSGRYAYVADDTQGLAIIDIKNPASPVLAKSFNSVSTIYGVNVAGDYAYLEGTGSALYVVNVSSSTNPVLASQYGTSGSGNGAVTVYGRNAIVSDVTYGIKIFALPGTYSPTANIGNISSHDISATGIINSSILNGGSLTISGNSLFGNSIGVYGTSTLLDLVVSRNVGSDLIPAQDNTFSLGSASRRWKGVWATGVTSTWIGAGTVSTTKLYVNGSLIGGTPSLQQVTNVGATTNKWIKFSGATSVGNFMPSSTQTYDLGSSNYRWDDVFTNNVSALPSSGSAYTQVTSTNYGSATTYGSDLVGNYLYVTNMPSAGYMSVIDVSMPSSLALKGSVQVSGASLWSLNVEGKYAYLADNGGNFFIVDISNPAVPVKIKGLSIGGNPWSSDIHVQGKYVYVPSYQDSHWHIIDVSVPASAYIVGTAAGYQSPAMDVQGNVAYVLGYSNNTIYSYDVTNPASPTLLYSTSTMSATWESLIVEGRYAYGIGMSGQFTIIDISNPSYMRVVATASGLGNVNDGGSKMHFDGKYLYVPSTSGYVRVIDVSNPSSISSVTISTTFAATGVNVDGRYMYVNGASGGLKVFDVRGAEVNGLLAHSAEMGSLQVRNESVFNGNVMMNEALHIGVGGLYIESGLFAASTSTILGGMTMGTGSKTANDYFRLNVAGHVGPSTTNMYDLGSSSYRWRNLWANNATFTNVYASNVVSTTKLYVNGQQITPSSGNPFIQNGNSFAASGTLGTNDNYPLVFETNNTSRIKLTSATVSSLQPVTNLGADLGDTSHRWRDVWASSTRIGTSTWELWQSNVGFTLSKAFSKKLIVTNSGNLLGGSNNAQDIGSAAASWRNVYASGTSFLASIWSKTANVSNPDSNSITEVASITLGYGEGPTVVQGNYVYRVGDGNPTYLTIYDVSVPTSPSSTAKLNLGHYTSGLRVSGKYAVASYTNVFSVIDISNPKSPVLLSTTNIGGNEYKGLDLAGGYVYTVDNQTGTLKIYDINNPSSPSYVGGVSTNGTTPNSVVVQGKYAYVSNYGSNTLSVIDVSNPAAPAFVSTSTLNTSPVSIDVQGRYVYTAYYGSNTLTVTDVMAPTNTRMIGSVNLGSHVLNNYLQSLTVQGRYAYVGLYDNTLKVVDVANPFSPTVVASKALSSYGSSPTVNGKYLYLSVYGGKLSIFDLGGIETNSLLAHALNAGNLNVSKNANISRLTADSAMIGIGGLAIEGRLSAMATSTLRHTLPGSANAYDLGSTTLPWRNIYFDSLTQSIPVGSTFSLVSSVSTGSGKAPYDVKVIGRYAYVANGYGDNVAIMDVTIPSSPALMGSVTVSGEPNKIEVRGKYAYVTSRVGDRMTIIDVSDVKNPTVTGYVTGMGNPIGLAVSGMYAYVADTGNTKGVSVVDISNPAAPYVVTNAFINNEPPQDVYIQGDYLYVTMTGGTGHFAIYHIANPASPVLVKDLTTNYVPRGVTVQGRYAYLTDGSNNAMTVVDVSSSTAPTVVTDFALGSGASPQYVAVQGKYAYITKYSSPGYVSVVDVSNPASPVLINSFTSGSYLFSPHIAGRYLYVADYGSSKLSIYDIKGAEFNAMVANSAEAGTLQVRNNAYVANHMSVGSGLTVDGAGIYSNGNIAMQSWVMQQLTDGSFALGRGNYNKVQITPVGTLKSINPQPSRVGGVNLSANGATDVEVVGKYAYVATSDAYDNSEDLQVYDISDPNYPRVGGININGSSAKTITIAGNYAYLGAYDNSSGVGFGIYDISDPTNITKKSFTSFGWNSEYPYEIRVVGKYAYMVTGGTFSRYFKIFDISNPSSPVQVYTTGMSNWTYALDVEGNYAYLGDDAGKFMIYDVTTPSNPTLKKTITLPGSHAINQLEVVGTKAYFASYDADGSTKDMVIYDVSSSTNPVYKGGFNVGGSTVYSVQVAGNYAYLSTNSAGYGLTVVDVSNPVGPYLVGATGSYNNMGKMFVSGKYAYYTISNEPTYQEDLMIFDIGGIESSTANIAAVKSENLDVAENASVNRLLAKVAHVGLGGIFTQGSLGVAATGTVTDLVVSRHVGSDLMPWASQTYSLGDSTHQWKNAYFSGTVTTTNLSVGGLSLTPGNYFAQNGNSFGIGAVLGTNDNNSLSFEVNNTPRAQIDTNGTFSVLGTNNNSQLVVRGALTQKLNQPLFVLATSTGSVITSITASTADTFFVGNNAGAKVLGSNTSANYFIGNNAGANVTSGFWNIAIGTSALQSLVSNGDNTAIGNYAANQATGSDNTAIGHQAMRYSSIGYYNTAIGSNSLLNNITGAENTAVGYASLYNNKSATSTVAIGYDAAFGAPGYSNQNGVYLGSYAGYSLTTGSNANTMIGRSAGYSNTSGYNNIFLGYQAGSNVTTGHDNLIIGFNVSAPKATGNYQLNIGNNIYGDLQNNRIGIGVAYPYTAKLVVAGDVYPSSTNSYDLGSTNYKWRNLWATNATFTSLYVNNQSITSIAGAWIQDGNSYSATGTLGTNDNFPLVFEVNGNPKIKLNTASTASLQPITNLDVDLGDTSHRWRDVWASSTRIGTSTWEIWQSNKGFTVSTGFAKFLLLNKYNISMGNQAGSGLTTGLSNVAIGPAAMARNATGGFNTALGDSAMQGPLGGGSSWYNTGIGASSLGRVTTGASNTAVGYASLYNNTTGKNNVAIGLNSQYSNIAGEESVSVGNGSLYTTDGNYNTAVGHQSMYVQGGEFNTAMGWKSMYGDTGGGSGNTAYGASSLFKLSSGEDNVAIGLQALNNNTYGSYNVAVGPFALASNTGSGENVAVGNSALGSNTAYGNSAVGSYSLYYNSTGVGNVGMGYYTQFGNQKGNNNTSIGYMSLYGNGATNNYSYNTAIGTNSMYSITTGASNTATGYKSLYSITTGNHNTAYGFNSLSSNTNGEYNTAVGSNALDAIAGGSGNNAFGYYSLTNLSSGSNNAAFGTASMRDLTTGNLNTSIGVNSMAALSSGNNNTALGYYAARGGGAATFSHNTAVGAYSMFGLTTGASNTAVGFQSLYSNNTGTYNSSFGLNSLYSNTSGRTNSAFGVNTLYSNTTGAGNVAFGNVGLYSNQTGSYNTAVGVSALQLNVTGASNTAMGYAALFNNTSFKNTAVGLEAMYTNSNGYDNAAFGFKAMHENTSGYFNVALGSNSMNANTTGDSNIGVGYQTLLYNQTGSRNNSVGAYSLRGTSLNSHHDNTAMGDRAGYSVTTGSYNVAIGNSSLDHLTTGASNTAVGYYALHSNTIGIKNVALGLRAMGGGISGEGSIAIGPDAGYQISGLNNIAIGDRAMYYSNAADTMIGIGTQALYNSDGQFNVAVGHSSQMSSTVGDNNVSLGDGTMHYNVAGSGNTAIGDQSLYGTATYSFSNNTAIGQSSMGNIRSGSDNVAVGNSTILNLTTGVSNTAVGLRSMYSNTSGFANVAIGSESLYKNQTSAGNVAVGVNALHEAVSGPNTAVGFYALASVGSTDNDNTALGYLAGANIGSTSAEAVDNTAIGHYSMANTDGGVQNTAVGSNSLFNNVSGLNNVSIGYHSLFDSNGSNNTAVGATALDAFTGDGAVAIGSSAGSSNVSGSYFTGVGYEAAKSSTASWVTALGYQAMYKNTTGFANFGGGSFAMWENKRGDYNTALGHGSMGLGDDISYNTAAGALSMYYASSSWNTAIGYQAMQGQSSITYVSGDYNTSLGAQALMDDTSGHRNVALGAVALTNNRDGAWNVAVGTDAMQTNTSGDYNTSMGFEALFTGNADGNTAVGAQAAKYNSSGIYNTAIGNNALTYQTTGSYNTAIGYVSQYGAASLNAHSYNTSNGYYSLYAITTGSYNTAMGSNAMDSLQNGSYNTADGYLAGSSITSGNGSVMMGYQAGDSVTTGGYNVIIGYGADSYTTGTNAIAIGYQATAYSNQVRIGNSSIVSIGGYKGWVNYSDARMKHDIATNTSLGLEFVKKLRPVTYRMNSTNELMDGFIAQDVLEAMKSASTTFSGLDDYEYKQGGYYSLDYSNFVVPLTNAVKTLDSRTDKLAQGIEINDLFATGTQFLTVNASGTVAFASSDIGATGIATSSTQGYDSGMFTLQGSGWDAVSSTPVTTNFKLYNHTVNATTSEMIIGFATGTNGITNYGLRITNLGDVSVSGKLYLGSKKYGVASTSTYMFVDDVLAPTSTYIATNADGWETQNTYDYAERYESTEKLVPGDLVVADPSGVNKVMRATSVTQALLGIVSTKPGFVTGRYYEGNYPIALAGRVPTRVSTANGSIAVGDYLTVQEGNPGVAVKATGAGNVVGIALESYDKVEEGLISVFVKPSYTMGTIAQTGSQTVIQTVQPVQTTQRVEIEGLASILAGATEVHVSYNTILAFPMTYATPHASIDGSWWIANRTDKGFDIIISQAQTHDVDFTWMARPMRAGTVRFVSDNTHQTVDDLTGQPYGPQLSDVITTTTTTSTDTGTSTDSGITLDSGTTTTATNIQTQANSSSTTP